MLLVAEEPPHNNQNVLPYKGLCFSWFFEYVQRVAEPLGTFMGGGGGGGLHTYIPSCPDVVELRQAEVLGR